MVYGSAVPTTTAQVIWFLQVMLIITSKSHGQPKDRSLLSKFSLEVLHAFGLACQSKTALCSLSARPRLLLEGTLAQRSLYTVHACIRSPCAHQALILLFYG